MFERTLQACLKTLRRFGSARQGVAAIEIGLLGLPFFMLIIGVIVVGFMMFCHSTLDYAAQRASRQIMIGTPQSQNMSVSTFTTQVVCPFLPSPLFDCTKVVINLKIVPETWEPTNWYTYVNADQTGLTLPPLSTVQNSFCLGAGNSYQLLEVLYPLPVYLSVFGTASNVVQNKLVIMATAAFKNEPFQGGAASASGC